MKLHPKRNKISQTGTRHGRQYPLWRDGTRYPAVDHLSKFKRRHFLFSDIARKTETLLYFGPSHVPGLLAFTSHSISRASTTWHGINLRN